MHRPRCSASTTTCTSWKLASAWRSRELGDLQAMHALAELMERRRQVIYGMTLRLKTRVAEDRDDHAR
jgi:hypothetical protein